MSKLRSSLLSIFLPSNLFTKRTKEEIFWRWFVKNEALLYELTQSYDFLLEKLSSQLTSYKEGITFELSLQDGGIKELIISADGLQELFPAVEALINSAPNIDRWLFTAYRPRIEDYSKCDLVFDGRHIYPWTIWTYSHVEDGFFDLIIYHPQYTEQERDWFAAATYIMLDAALGEYDVVTGIRYIDYQKLPLNPEERNLIPFSELRGEFDKYKTENRNQYLN